MQLTLFQPVAAHTIRIAGVVYKCSIGRSGIRENKRKGDGATPAGSFLLRKIFYRPDRINLAEINTQLPIEPLAKDDGWCDDANFPKYNMQVKLPFSGSHEELWRDDHLYDLIVVVGYNDNPVEKDKGSAIFMHIAREGYLPTAGCIAFAKKDLLEILPSLTPNTVLNVAKTGEIELECAKTPSATCLLVSMP